MKFGLYLKISHLTATALREPTKRRINNKIKSFRIEIDKYFLALFFPCLGQFTMRLKHLHWKIVLHRSFHCTLIPIQTCLFHQLPSINHVRDLLVLTWNILYRVTKFEVRNSEMISWFFSLPLECLFSLALKIPYLRHVQWCKYIFLEVQTM